MTRAIRGPISEFEYERMLWEISGRVTESARPLLTGFRRGVDTGRLWGAARAAERDVC
jgi:hypothetical protein